MTNMMSVSDLVAILAVIVGILAIVMTLIHQHKYTEKLDALDKNFTHLKEHINNLDLKQSSQAWVDDTIAEALHCLSRRQAILANGLFSGTHHNLLETIDQEEVDTFEQLAAELGLFSESKERRVSAQRTLAVGIGDSRSLTLLKLIESGTAGRRDQEIVENINRLKTRLNKLGETESNRKGRIGKGSF